MNRVESDNIVPNAAVASVEKISATDQEYMNAAVIALKEAQANWQFISRMLVQRYSLGTVDFVSEDGVITRGAAQNTLINHSESTRNTGGKAEVEK